MVIISGVTSKVRRELRPTEGISKPFVVFFILMQVLFGYKYGFEATVNRYLKAAAHFISLLLFTWIVSATCVSIFSGEYLDWHLFAVFTYYIIMFIILRLPKYTMFDYYKDLSEIDKKWNLVVKNFRISLQAFFYFHSLFFFRITVTPLICVCDSYWKDFVKFFTVGMMYNVFHALPLVHASMFYQVYIRIKVLRSEIRTGRIRTRDLKIVLKSIVNCLAKIRVSEDNAIAVGFIGDCAYGIFSIYHRICDMTQYQNVYAEIIFVLDTLHFVIGIWLPAVFAEMIAHEVNKMKIVIYECLLCETDVDISQELLRLLRYLEGCQLLRPAWRLVPVDFRRPLTLLSISVTYLIVLLQFTHMY